MALPPKTDDDTPSSSRADSAAGEKKTRRPRPRTRAAKPAEEKVAKPAKSRARRGAAPKQEQTEFLPAVEPREQRPEPAPPPAAPREERESREKREERAEREQRGQNEVREVREAREVREEASPAREREQTPETSPDHGAERSNERRDDSAGSRDVSSDIPKSYSTSEADVSGQSDSAPPPATGDSNTDRNRPQGGNSQGGGQQHGGGRGDWQGQQGQHGHHGGGGGGQDRGFWKHGKRKRGRHGGGGGHWQPGGGGGGGGGREQHPPQPPPPSNTPVFGDLPNPSRFGDLAALDALANEVSSGTGEALWLNQIYAKTLAELTTFSRELGVRFEGAPNKRQLLSEIFKFAAENKRTLRDVGYIDQNDRGSFVVHEHVNYRFYPEDPYLPDSLVKRFGLKRGHRVEVTLQPPQEGERCASVVRIDRVMGMAPEDISKVTPFEELVPYYPLQRVLLEDPDVVKDVSMRAVDILTPIGFGQRGLIVAPPRTGKTILLQNIANSISANSPEVKLILLLIDERPEEVTDFKRHTKGEVVSSTFDETPESHVHCAEMVIEIARRRIEQGEHVVILLDSITRLARAYNALAGNQGKTMSGGLESNALQKPKRFFGSARNIEGGGSLTIIASALIDTGSRMDEIIFEEFKGTGNSELHLDRGLVERRIFPAINIDRSGTRKEELLYHPEELQRIYALRRAMQGLGPIESMEMLITRLKKTKSNTEFLLSLAPK
jgi:transcription termination factor Rho